MPKEQTIKNIQRISFEYAQEVSVLLKEFRLRLEAIQKRIANDQIEKIRKNLKL